MEKKVVLKVELEFYPSEYEAWGDRLPSLTDEELASQSHQLIEEHLTSVALDGLWHHIELVTTVVSPAFGEQIETARIVPTYE
jgi:hypothetical protein